MAIKILIANRERIIQKYSGNNGAGRRVLQPLSQPINYQPQADEDSIMQLLGKSSYQGIVLYNNAHKVITTKTAKLGISGIVLEIQNVDNNETQFEAVSETIFCESDYDTARIYRL